MERISNILAALGDERESATYVLEKAVALAEATGARLHVVRVIYEGIAELGAAAIDSAADLKRLILESEETITEEMVEGTRERLPALETATLWNERRWEGVLHAAELAGAQLIIKGATRHHRFDEVVRTPDDWNLLRSARVPVMLVKPQAWVANPVLVCALDVFDDSHASLNQALLKEAGFLAAALGGELHVVVAYPLFERWVGDFGGLRDYDALKREIETEVVHRVRNAAEAVGVDYRQLYVDEGHPAQVIGALAEDLNAELVVVGTHARQGLRGVLLGNTSERLVHHLATDVVTVQTPART